MVAMMIIPPEKILAAPNPAMALPTMRTTDDGATAQTRDPTSKIKTPAINTHLVEYMVYSLPKISCTAAVARIYALPYQATSFSELNWLVIRGMAVARIVWSWKRDNLSISACHQLRRMGHTYHGDAKDREAKADCHWHEFPD